MSSLRNAVKRVTHKERGQLQSRSHLGMLEKKQDYKKRSENYHKRQERIHSMQLRASQRNPDEFYFGMNRAEVVDGHHRKTVAARQKEFEEQIGEDTIRIMKDQDIKYIRLQKQKDISKVEKLKSSLHFIDTDVSSKKRKHTIFVDTKVDVDNFDAAEYFNTVPELVNRVHNRPRIDMLKKLALEKAGVVREDLINDGINTPARIRNVADLEKQQLKDHEVLKEVIRARDKSYLEMSERQKRVVAMENAEAHLQTEKLIRSKGQKRKIAPAANGKPAVYKWRKQRLG